MADYEDIMDVYRIREATGIGTSRVYPLSRVAKKKKRSAQKQGEYLEKTKEKESPKSCEGVDIEV